MEGGRRNKQKKEKKVKNDEPVTRDMTINLKKRLHKVTFKRKAPTAIREIKKFAAVHMRTSDNRVTVGLNQFVWSKGIKSVPGKVRVRLQRKKNEDEDAEEKLYTLISYVPEPSLKGLLTETVKDDDEE